MSGWARTIRGKACPECGSDGPHTEFGEPAPNQYPKVELVFECGSCVHEWAEIEGTTDEDGFDR